MCDVSLPPRRRSTAVSPPYSSTLGAVLFLNPTGPTTTESLGLSYPKRISRRRLPSCEWGGAPGGADPLRLRMLVLAAVRMNAPACALAQAVGAPEIPGPAYAWAKGLYAGALTWLLQPVMLFAILAAAPPAASPAAHPAREG